MVDEALDLMEPKEVAELLGVTEGTLVNWRTKGRGPRYIKSGKAVKYRRAAVAEWIMEQETE